MAKVSFDMILTQRGKQEVILPDSVDPNNREAVLDYIYSEWHRIPRPTDTDLIGDDLDESTLVVLGC